MIEKDKKIIGCVVISVTAFAFAVIAGIAFNPTMTAAFGLFAVVISCLSLSVIDNI